MDHLLTSPTVPTLGWGERFWRGIISHRPLKRHIEWWLKLLAIAAVPLTIICTIIVAAELSTPDWFTKGLGLALGAGAEDALNVAIEASMLGCIALAKQAQREDHPRYALAMTLLGAGFAALTCTTVGFHVFNASPLADKVLLLVRCGAAIIYCYVSHMCEEEDAGESIPARQHHAQLEALTQRFTQQLEQVKTQLAGFQQESEARFQERFHAMLEPFIAAQLAGFQEQQTNALRGFQQDLDERFQILTKRALESVAQPRQKDGQVEEQRHGRNGSTAKRQRGSHGRAPVPSNVTPLVPAGNMEPVMQRAIRYITEQRAHGSMPGLPEIMTACTCSKGTAQRARQAVLGMSEGKEEGRRTAPLASERVDGDIYHAQQEA